MYWHPEAERVALTDATHALIVPVNATVTRRKMSCKGGINADDERERGSEEERVRKRKRELAEDALKKLYDEREGE